MMVDLLIHSNSNLIYQSYYCNILLNMQQQITDPIDFSQLGCFFTINSKVGLPDYKIHRLNIRRFPFCDVGWLKKTIVEELSDIEGLRFEYDEKKFCWNIEYGTRPIEYTDVVDNYKLFQIIQKKKWCAFEASMKASELFTRPDYDDERNEPCRSWFQGDIRLFYDELKNEIVIEINRVRGDTPMFYCIKNSINEVLSDTRIQNWAKRRNYLMFIEGTHDYVENNITRFLFDEMICREISCFL
jgi:hypothetical protein